MMKTILIEAFSVSIKIAVFWDMMPCSLVEGGFGGNLSTLKMFI
jgi:hypothetical protein